MLVLFYLIPYPSNTKDVITKHIARSVKSTVKEKRNIYIYIYIYSTKFKIEYKRTVTNTVQLDKRIDV
jgi:hypothetical protein